MVVGKRFGKARASGVPSEAVERKMRILLELIRNKFVTVSRLCEEYETSERSLLRDFQEMRSIGERAGFALSEKIENDQIRLLTFDARPTALGKGDRALRSLIHDTAHAFGEPVERQVEPLVPEAPSEQRFLKFLVPKLREGSRIAEVYNALQAAWANNARVAFEYSGKERLVEPALVIVRSGRYYLVARDPKTREWKYFGLDKIEGTIARAGSFSPQPVPERYVSSDVIGFLQGDAAAGVQDVTVWLSPNIAHSATAREWQRDQRIAYADDGSATITFTVSDVDEVVRWSFGFGPEARIVAPQSAVAMARTMAEHIRDAYVS